MKKKLSIIVALLLAAAALLSLAACGETEKFDITLDYGYGDKTETVSVEGVFTLPAPVSRDGFAFEGWFKQDGSPAGSFVIVNAAATYTAKWRRTGAVTVSFELPEGETPIPEISTYSGEKIILPAAPDFDGKEFQGWSNQFGQTYAENAEFTVGNEAKYIFTASAKSRVDVAYSVEGATPPKGQSVLEGDEIVLANAPEKVGYSFKGWLNAGKTYEAGAAISAVAGSSDRMIFVAVYKKLVNLTFMIDGKEEFTASVCDGDLYEMPALTVTNGLILSGWKQVGQDTEIAVGEKYAVKAEDSVFTAILDKAYLVTFYAEDRQTVVDFQWVAEGDSAKAPAYDYSQSAKWYESFTGLTPFDNITAYTSVYPVYGYVASDISLFDFTGLGQEGSYYAYTVRYAGYANGMLTNGPEDLKLPDFYNGKPVVGITANTATSYNEASAKKGGFALSKKVKRIYIPASYEELANLAFAYDTALTEVVFGEGSKLLNINMFAFAGCKALTSVEIPKSVGYVGKQAFVECGALSEIKFEKGGVRDLVIEEEAFAAGAGVSIKATDISSLLSIEFPARTVSIGARVLKYQLRLKNLSFENDGSGYPLTIKDAAFSGLASGSASTSIPSSVYPLDIKEIEIPSRTVYIGVGAFAAQIKIEKIIFPVRQDFTTFGAYAFAHLISLKELTLPNGLTQIPVGAFARANGAYKYSLPEAPAKLIIPVSGQFGYSEYGFDGALAIPDGVTVIDESAFYQQNNLSSITFPSSLEVIGKNAFGISGNPNEKVKRIELPKSLKTLGDFNFGNFIGVTFFTVDCPLLETMGSVFSHSAPMNSSSKRPAAMRINFTNIAKLKVIKKNSFMYTNISLIYYGSYTPTVDLVIEDNVFTGNYSPADGIMSYSELETVKLPANLVSLGNTAFKYLSNLKSFEVASGNSAFTAEDGVLYYIGGGAKVLQNYPGGLRGKAVIPEGVTEIGDNAFKAVPVTEVEFPSTLVRIGKTAFHGTLLSYVYVPSNVKSIDNQAFSRCPIVSAYCDAEAIDTFLYDTYLLETVTFGPNVKNMASSFVSSLRTGGAPSKLVSIYLQGSTVKNLGAGTIMYGVDRTFSIIVDSQDMVGAYGAVQQWGGDLAPLFTVKATVTFGEQQVTAGKNAKIAPCLVPDDGKGGVWVYSDMTLFDITMPIGGDVILYRAYTVEVIADGHSTVYVLKEGSNLQKQLPDVENKLYFDDNGELFDTSTPINRSMVLEAKKAYDVTFKGAGEANADVVVKVAEGEAISERQIPKSDDYFWATSDTATYLRLSGKDVSSEYDFTQPIDGDVELIKFIYIYMVDDAGYNAEGQAVYKFAARPGSKILSDTTGIKKSAALDNHKWIDGDGKTVIEAPLCAAKKAWVTDKNFNDSTKLMDFATAVFNKTTYVYCDTVFDVTFTYGTGVVYVTAVGTANAPKAALITPPAPTDGYSWVSSKDVIWDFDTMVIDWKAVAFKLAALVKVTFEGNDGDIVLIKNTPVPAASIPAGYTWCTVSNGVPAAWTTTSNINADTVLYKYQKVTFNMTGSAKKEILVKHGEGLDAVQLGQIALPENYVYTNAAGDETVIDVGVKFTAAAIYNAKEKILVTVTFVDGNGGSDKVLNGVIKGSKLSSSDIPSDGTVNYVWVIKGGTESAPTYTEFNSSSTVSGTLILYKKIKITVSVSAAAAADGQAVNKTYYYDIGSQPTALPVLADNFGYVDASGKLVKDIISPDLAKSGSYTAKATRTYIFVDENGTAVEITVLA